MRLPRYLKASRHASARPMSPQDAGRTACSQTRMVCAQVLRLLHRMWDTSGDLFVAPYEMRPVRSPDLPPSSVSRFLLLKSQAPSCMGHHPRFNNIAPQYHLEHLMSCT